MKRGILVLLLGVLALALFWFSRESFTNPEVLEPTVGDKALESKIKALGPTGVDVGVQTSFLKDFQDNVQKTAPEEPTEQMVDAWLNGREVSMNPNDKDPLKEIIMEWFKIKRSLTGAQREAEQIQFTPSATALGTETTEPNKGGPSPTDVGNTVMTQLSQMQPIGRGGSGAAYGLDAQNQDTPMTMNVAQKPPSVGTPQTTVQSALAEVPVKTQEIQGPRISKMAVPPMQKLEVPKEDDSKAYPKVFGPDAAPKGNGIGNLTGNNALAGTSLPTKAVGLPAVTLPNTVEVEPIPVLTDFSKFF